MDFTYESQGTNTYLVYTIRDDDVVDSMSLGMLTNNKIPGLAQALFMQMDSEKYIKYNVTSKISVRQFLDGTVSRKRLLGIFSGITEGLLAAEDYMIDENSVLLDLDYIFADVSTCEAVLICWPICDTELQQNDLKAFFKNIMVNTQFDATENSDYIAKIFNFLNSASVFSLVEFKKLLDELKNERAGAYISAEPQQEVRQPEQRQPEVRQAAQGQPEAREAQPRQPQQSAAVPTKQEPVKQSSARQTPPAPGQMAISPAAKPAPAAVQQGQQGQKTEEKPEKQMSMFNLLMHYSAENKKLYQQQKAEKKAQHEKPAAKESHKKNAAGNVGFAVPGAAAGNAGFAVPGQAPVQPSVVQPAAAPGRPTNVQPTPTVVQQQSATGQAPTPAMPPQQPEMQGQRMNFGETTILGGGGYGETTVLSAGMLQPQKTMPYLLRLKNNEKITLDKPVFRIGKEKSYVDYFIGDNTAVSRSHANIITRDDGYSIMDTNSTNHTYVNGSMIQSNVEIELSDGAKIRLGNEDFEFHLH